MTTKASKSYEYNAICDICGFKKKSYELRKRWDGFWVCEKDWEPRHILDFYRTKNDVHILPFTRPDTQNELTWTPVFTGLTETPGNGAITISGSYKRDTVNQVINFVVTIIVTVDATTDSFPATMTVPVACVTAGTLTIIDSQATIIGDGSIPASGSTALLPPWTGINNNMTITGRYGY